jgi:hypothetical protein
MNWQIQDYIDTIFVTGLIIISLLSVPTISVPALAQNANESGNGIEFSTKYKSAYPKIIADAAKPVTVQPEYHLYKPGDRVKVEGSVWIELIRQVYPFDLIAVKVKDSKGNVIAVEEVDIGSEGNYATEFTLLASAEEGVYTVECAIEIKADLLGVVKTVTAAALQDSANFAVSSYDKHIVEYENNDFEVSIASNSNVQDFNFKQQEKKVEFLVEGNTGTMGVTEITIPTALLSGEMVVFIDQNIAVGYDVIIKSETDAATTFEINYTHSIHRIEVSGTNAIPEFPVTFLIVTVAIGSLIAVTARRNLSIFRWI